MIRLWVGLNVLNTCDGILTAVLLHHGATEANPALRALFALGVLWCLAVKLVNVAAGSFLLAAVGMRRVMLAAIGLYGLVVLSELFAIGAWL